MYTFTRESQKDHVSILSFIGKVPGCVQEANIGIYFYLLISSLTYDTMLEKSRANQYE